MGEGSIVRNCVFSDNGDIGLWARDASTVESCVARGNADAGFLLDALCSGRGLTASLNGSVGIVANVHAALINCTATENMGGGISVNRASLVNCTANRNTGSGIRGFFFSATSCTAADNIFDGEATDPTGVGFRLGGACLVTDSVARGNAAIGILVEDGSILAMGSTVIGCEVNLNGNNFIGVPEPLAGILVTGVANRIDGNTVTGSPRGIHVTGTDNLIVRNAASDSSTANFDIATDNAFGPIINVARIGDITTAVGDTHPWANFEF